MVNKVRQLLPAGITGTGRAIPEKVLTNADLERMVDTSDEWIRTRTGIVERRIAEAHIASSDLGAEAGRKALEDAGVKPEDVDLVIVGTITPDMAFPATACIIQDKLGLTNAAAFDLSAGCSGFVYALDVAASFVTAGKYRTVLVIGADTLSKIIDFTDRSTCVLFGDGAGAAVVQPVEEDYGILATYLGSDGSGGTRCTCRPVARVCRPRRRPSGIGSILFVCPAMKFSSLPFGSWGKPLVKSCSGLASVPMMLTCLSPIRRIPGSLTPPPDGWDSIQSGFS